jgi:hypothetical protein
LLVTMKLQSDAILESCSLLSVSVSSPLFYFVLVVVCLENSVLYNVDRNRSSFFTAILEMHKSYFFFQARPNTNQRNICVSIFQTHVRLLGIHHGMDAIDSKTGINQLKKHSMHQWFCFHMYTIHTVHTTEKCYF